MNKFNKANLSVQMAPRAVNWVEMPLQQYFIVFWGAPDALMNQASHWASQQVSDKITLKRLPVNPWPQKPCISWIQEKWMALTMGSNSFGRIILILEQLYFNNIFRKVSYFYVKILRKHRCMKIRMLLRKKDFTPLWPYSRVVRLPARRFLTKWYELTYYRYRPINYVRSQAEWILVESFCG